MTRGIQYDGGQFGYSEPGQLYPQQLNVTTDLNNFVRKKKTQPRNPCSAILRPFRATCPWIKCKEGEIRVIGETGRRMGYDWVVGLEASSGSLITKLWR